MTKQKPWKMPFLLIPLINEVFGTEYSQEQEFEQLRNEHYEKFGKVITDSIIRIGRHLYHIECQSERDGSMAVRMMEYDFAIALEHSLPSEDGILEISFPESCVLYIRNHKDMPDHHEARVRFADGQTVVYRVPVILAQDYTVSRIFEKRLLLLLPYHILRYERFLKSNRENPGKMERLLSDYREINRRLSELRENGEKSGVYVDLIELINRIADYVIPKDNLSRERMGEVMGGQILKLRSEELREEGEARGANYKLACQVCRKLRKGKGPEMIAQELEEDLEVIQKICQAAAEFGPEYDEKRVFAAFMKSFE